MNRSWSPSLSASKKTAPVAGGVNPSSDDSRDVDEATVAVVQVQDVALDTRGQEVDKPVVVDVGNSRTVGDDRGR